MKCFLWCLCSFVLLRFLLFRAFVVVVFNQTCLKWRKELPRHNWWFFFVQAHFALFVMRKLLVKANMVRVQGNKIWIYWDTNKNWIKTLIVFVYAISWATFVNLFQFLSQAQFTQRFWFPGTNLFYAGLFNGIIFSQRVCAGHLNSFGVCTLLTCSSQKDLTCLSWQWFPSRPPWILSQAWPVHSVWLAAWSGCCRWIWEIRPHNLFFHVQQLVSFAPWVALKVWLHIFLLSVVSHWG